jgi:putative ABC transport system permease protein
MGPDQDDLVLIPLAAFQHRLAGREDVNAIFVSARTELELPGVQRRIEELLRRRRRIGKDRSDNFKVHDMKQLTGALNSVAGALTALLAAIAGVTWWWAESAS